MIFYYLRLLIQIKDSELLCTNKRECILFV